MNCTWDENVRTVKKNNYFQQKFLSFDRGANEIVNTAQKFENDYNVAPWTRPIVLEFSVAIEYLV